MRSRGTPGLAQSSKASSSPGMPSSPLKTVTDQALDGSRPSTWVTNSQPQAMASSLK